MRDKDLTLQTDEGGTLRSPSSVFCSVSEHLPPARRQPFTAELATLPHRPWAPKPSEPSISGISSTKSRFLCAFALRNPHFQAFRAQNRHFCVRNGDFSLVLAPFEHKIGLFVLGKMGNWHQELCPGQVAESFAIRYMRPWPGDSLIRRRYVGGVGNRCRWADRFASV